MAQSLFSGTIRVVVGHGANDYLPVQVCLARIPVVLSARLPSGILTLSHLIATAIFLGLLFAPFILMLGRISRLILPRLTLAGLLVFLTLLVLLFLFPLFAIRLGTLVALILSCHDSPLGVSPD